MRYRVGDMLHLECRIKDYEYDFVGIVEETFSILRRSIIDSKDLIAGDENVFQLTNVYQLKLMKGNVSVDEGRLFIQEKDIDFTKCYFLFDFGNCKIEKLLFKGQEIRTLIPEKVNELITYHLAMLNELYPERDLDSTGGQVLIVNDIDSLGMLNQIHIDVYEDIPEYTDLLVSNGEEWIESLFLMTEFAIVLYMKKEIAPINLLNYIDH